MDKDYNTPKINICCATCKHYSWYYLVCRKDGHEIGFNKEERTSYCRNWDGFRKDIGRAIYEFDKKIRILKKDNKYGRRCKEKT